MKTNSSLVEALPTFKGKKSLSQSRDPACVEPENGFDSENGEYVRPWVLVLNECGNRVSIMYLDTKTSKRQTSALLIQIRECSNSFTVTSA
jgi:hypothetical protein